MGGFFSLVGQLFGYVLWFFFDLFDNYPLAVVCFTLLVRLVFIPFELKSRRASLQMARLSRKQAELQKKYKNNKEKLNEELERLYAQENMNPLSGCLPQFFPLVAFLGVFSAISSPLTNMFHMSADKVNQAIALVGEKTQFAQLSVIKHFNQNPQLFSMFTESEKSDITDFNKGFNFFGMDLSAMPLASKFADFVWIWPALCIITMILSVVISQKLNPAPTTEGAGCVKFMPYVLSIPFIFIAINAPAGVGFYYALSNFLMIIQNVLIAKYYSPQIIAAKQEAARIALREIEESKVDKV